MHDLVLVFFNLNIKNFFIILKNRNKKIFLVKNKIFDLILFKLFKYFNYDIDFLIFDVAKIKIDSQNIRYYTLEKANQYADKISINIIENKKVFKRLNKFFDNSSIKDLIRYYTFLELSNVLLKIEITRYFIKKYNNIYLSELVPEYIRNFINDTYVDVNIICAKEEDIKYFYFKNKIRNFLKNYYYLLINFLKKKVIIQNNLPKVFSIQENSLIFSKTHRSHLHWINENEENLHNFVVMNNKNFKKKNEKFKNVTTLNYDNFYGLLKNKKIDKLLNKIENFILKNFDIQYSYITKKIIQSIAYANHFYPLSHKISFNIFLYSHYDQIINSFFLLKKFLNFKIVSYQYSSIYRDYPSVVQKTDYFFSFSDKFVDLIKQSSSRPKNFLVTGCLYENYFNTLKNKCLQIQNKYKSNLKIAYLDERLDADNFGLINLKRYKFNFEKLFQYLNKNNNAVLFFKSQFSENRLSKLFKKNYIFKKLINEGRIIELLDDYGGIIDDYGGIRNNVLPMQVAIISDFVICQKFGGTTAIECATIGSKVLLLNEFNFRHHLDKYIKTSQIEYNNIEDIILAIDSFKEDSKFKNLGNWDKVINNFSSRNFNSVSYGKKNLFRDKILEIIKN